MINMLKDLWVALGPYRKRLFIAYFLALPLAGIKTFQTYLVKDIFDKGFSPDSSLQSVYWVAGLLLMSQLLNHPIRYLHFYHLRLTIETFTAGIRQRLLDKIQTLPIAYLQSEKQGKILALTMNDTSLFSESIRHSVTVLREPLTAIGLLSVAVYHDWQLALILVFTAPVLIKVFSYTGKKIRFYGTKVQEGIGLMTQNVSESLSGQKIIKAFGLHHFARGRFDDSLAEYMKNQKRFINVEEHTHPLVESIGAFAISLIIIYAHHRVQQGALTTGAFISFFAAIIMFNDSLKKFSDANIRLNQARSAKERIFNFLGLTTEPETGRYAGESFTKEIEIKNLSFSYGADKVLRSISLKIPVGKKIAFVGLSGSGKSTLVNLLQRFYTVEKGSILIDGVDINDYQLSSLRRFYALVSQDVFLFNDSIRNNICCGHDFSDEQIREALDVSYVSEYLEKLPQGIETQIGDRGINLSGGQAQRLTIARAYLQNRPILLFDEATSSLDNESEKMVQRALEKVANNKTVIAVAHRLSTIQQYDKIYVFKDGKIVEEGIHDELIGLNGEYTKLYELSQS